MSQAFVEVGRNKYYGFRQSLGSATSTGFKNVAWVAKEILVQMGKGDSLKDYQGWITRPECDTVLNELIQGWIRDSSQNEAALLVFEPVSKLERMGVQLFKQASQQYYLHSPITPAAGPEDHDHAADMNDLIREMQEWAIQPDADIPEIPVVPPEETVAVLKVWGFL